MFLVLVFLILNFPVVPQDAKSGGTKKLYSLRSQDVPPTFKNKCFVTLPC